MKLNDTPIQTFPEYPDIYVKMRGVYQHLLKKKEEGIKHVGYVESSISMAGWGIAYLGEELGLKVTIFDPQYKETPKPLLRHRRMWDKFGAERVPLKAGMVKVNFNIARKMSKNWPNFYMLPLGMPVQETIYATSIEVQKTLKQLQEIENIASIVVNVGSGTVCAGIIRGVEFLSKCPPISIYGIMGRKGDVKKKRKSVLDKSDIGFNAELTQNTFTLSDPGWEYTKKSEIRAPFPCNPYYDLKAWEWLLNNQNNIAHPILFWSIGR